MQIHFSFCPRNLGISSSEDERLLQDLQRLLGTAPVLLMLLLGTGCSAKVDVSTEQSSGADTAKQHTNVELEFLAEQKTAPSPPPARDESSVAAEAPAQEVEVAKVANLAIVVENNVQIHRHRHTHLHVEAAPEPKRPKARPERIRPEISRPEADPECERLRREYEAKVIELQEFFAR